MKPESHSRPVRGVPKWSWYGLILACVIALIQFSDWQRHLHFGTRDPENPQSLSKEFKCTDQTYKTTILSRDPLLIYIHGFISAEESEILLTLGYV